MKIVFKLFLYLLALIPFSICAQNTSNKGVDFWIGFPAHGDRTRAEMYLYITGDSNTTGTVSIPGQSWSTNFTVTANAMTLVAVPTNRAYVACNDCIEARGIHVVSQKKIVVYSHIYYQYRSDATLVLPTATTGKEYFAMSYGQNGPSADRSQFMVVANKDNTKVRITPSTNLSSKTGGTLTKGTPYEITLNAGQVYQGRAKDRSFTDDVTGTRIEVIDTGANAGCKTVAVFSGSSNCFLGCSSGGAGIASRDNLYQQLYPTKSWGTRFVTVPFRGRTYDNIRIMAAEDGTQVIINHQTGAPTVAYLDRGEFYEMVDINQTKYILASKGICVAQFQESQKCGGKGDPSMTILNPIEQTLKQITVYSSQYEDIDDHYINVIIPTNGSASFKIDGSAVSFTKVPKLSSHSYAQIKVNQGNHIMAADVGFIAIAYGFGDYESYGYAAGANVKDLTAKLELVNSAQLDDNSMCLGDIAEFEGQAEYQVSQWIWDLGDGTKDTGQFIEHEYKTTGTFNVRLYTYKKSFDGCSTYDSSDMEVKVYTKPVADIRTSLRCEGNTVTFTDSSRSPSGDPLLTSQWIFHNSSTYAAQTSKYYDTAGIYKAWLIAKTEYQCTDTLKWDMVINPNPVAISNVADVCFKDSAYFSNISTIKTGKIATNKWHFGDGDSSTKYHPRHFYQSNGTYHIVFTATSDSGCSDVGHDTIYKHHSFTMNFTHQDTCAGFGLDFKNTSTTTGGTLKDYVWDFPGGTQYTTTDASHSFTNPGSYKVKLTGTLDDFCTDSIVKTIVVDPLVSADFTTAGVCLNDTVTFTSTSTVASGAIATLKWNLDESKTGSKQIEKVKYATKGLKNIQLIASSDKGCSDTMSKQITMVDPKISSLVFPLACEGKTVKIYPVLSLDGNTVSNYSWDVLGTITTSDTLTYSNNTAGKKVVTLTINTSSGCKLVKKDSFDLNAMPKPDFTISNVCRGFSIQPTNTSTIGNGESITSHQWYYNGSLASSAQNPTIISNLDGSSTMRLKVTSAKGCTDEITKTFDVYTLPVARFTYSDTCLGMTTAFVDNSTITSGTIDVYDWTYNDGVVDNGNYVIRTYPADGNYSLKHVVTSNFGCKDSITRNFKIAPKPQLNVTPDKLTGCMPLLVNFANSSTINSGTINNLSWDFGDGTTGTGVTPSKVYNAAGNYQVIVYGTSNANCKDTFQVGTLIDVLQKPTADFTYSPLEPSLLFPDVTYSNTSTPDAISFVWDVGDGNTYTSTNVAHTYATAGNFPVRLIATAANGCKDTADQLVYLKLDFFIWIPTVFSPNGDNTNDLFRVYGVIPDIQGYSMQIFNRWGEVIFESTNPNESWNGTYEGIDVYPGSYGYSVRYINYETGRWESKKGAIKVMR